MAVAQISTVLQLRVNVRFLDWASAPNLSDQKETNNGASAPKFLKNYPSIDDQHRSRLCQIN